MVWLYEDFLGKFFEVLLSVTVLLFLFEVADVSDAFSWGIDTCGSPAFPKLDQKLFQSSEMPSWFLLEILRAATREKQYTTNTSPIFIV